jgi:ABC-2 type transport system permease protein
MFERIKHILIKEFIQVLRDPKMKGIVFIAPIIQLLLFGYAVTTDVKHVPTAVYDLDNSADSRELVARFVGSGYFDVVRRIQTDEEARGVLDRGEASMVIRMNRGFQDDLRGGGPAMVQVLVDGTDSNTAQIALSYAIRIAAAFSRSVLVSQETRRQGTAVRLPEVDLRTRAWFNEDLESRNYFVPGVIAILVMLVTLMLTSMAIVREKEIGTMEQIMVTPITPLEFILGKTVPFVLIGFADMILVAVVGVFWFDVPIRGWPPLLLLSTGLYLMTSIGVGLFISTVCTTQQQAMMSTFFFFFPAQLLSGFIFPIANMPTVVQWLTYADPLRYFLIIIRGVFLKGVGFSILWPEMLGLAILGVITLSLAVSRFRKTMG